MAHMSCSNPQKEKPRWRPKYLEYSLPRGPKYPRTRYLGFWVIVNMVQVLGLGKDD